MPPEATTPTKSRDLYLRLLGYVRDEMSGRTFVVQRDVDTLLTDSADGYSAADA